MRRVVGWARGEVGLVILGLAFCVYAVLFIQRTSFVLEGQRHFCLFDDMMVSMRYARNLVEGHGLVWNPGGARVEGYTNPLWVLHMAAVHLLPLPDRLASLPVQVTGLVLLLLNVAAVKRLASASSLTGPWPLLAAGLTAFYYPLNNWGLQGTEVSALALLVTLSLLQAARCKSQGEGLPALYVLLGAMTLVRMDMLVWAGPVWVYMAIADAPRRRAHFAAGALALGVAVGGQTVFRWAYYGELLPNTYYLKLVGWPTTLRIMAGAGAVVRMFVQSPLALLVSMLLVPAVIRHSPARAVLAPCILLTAYSVYVGGDAWEGHGGTNRYISAAMPGFFVALTMGAAAVARQVTARLGRTEPPVVGWERAAAVAIGVVGLLAYNAITGAATWRETLCLQGIMHVEDNRRMATLAAAVRDITDDDATIAVTMAGTLPYMARRPTVDMLGKCDPYIAHQSMRPIPGRHAVLGFYPGHMKWDYAHSIGSLRPDLVLQLWQTREQAEPTLQALYRPTLLAGQTVYVRRDSTSVRPGHHP